VTKPPAHQLTSSQTVGPFFGPALVRADATQHVLTGPGTEGQRIRIEGCVYDGDGAPVPDALVEIWQANAYGRYNHPNDQSDAPLDPEFTGFGRAGADDSGSYWFETILPGPVAFDHERMQAPHIAVSVFARGLLNHLYTRIYFADEPANASDPILQLVPTDRRGTLLATRHDDSDEVVYRFDIILQGPEETVFFAY
jgi:protocatechuate 3,4-dioxygenase alpha subunit